MFGKIYWHLILTNYIRAALVGVIESGPIRKAPKNCQIHF